MDNRTKIMETALELFSQKGYDAVGIQEIVNCSGVGKPTMYHYFGNKEGLLEAILKKYSRELYDRLKGAANYEGDITLTLTEMAKTYFHFAREQALFYRMQLSMVYAPAESLTYRLIFPHVGGQYRLLEELFIAAAEQHGNMKGRHKRYAVSFIGMVNTYITLLYMNQLELDDKLIFSVVHQFMHGIFS